jgi:aspartate/methionine/tyrosine aminotransferase
MPTGAVLDQTEWLAIAEICRKTGARLLYDAAMERVIYDGLQYIHPASLPGMSDRTITVGSASKEYRMIGWRVGWVVGPPRVTEDIALVAVSNAVTPVGIAQAAVTSALNSSQENVLDAIAEWQRRRNAMLAELSPAFLVACPAGGWSMLLDLAELKLSSEVACDRLLKRGRVAATPMTGWGGAQSGRYVRFVFSNEGCDRLAGLGGRVAASLL